jgi:hypothetical protein
MRIRRDSLRASWDEGRSCDLRRAPQGLHPVTIPFIAKARVRFDAAGMRERAVPRP